MRPDASDDLPAPTASASPADGAIATGSTADPAAGSTAAGGPAVEICSGCHLPLVRRGPNGECLRCLLDSAFLTGDDPAFSDTVADAGSYTPAAQTVRYGHFEIALAADGHPVELGAGAMAVTYRALDTVLHTPVALKVIDKRVAEHPMARARFLREARAAAKLHHPNVANVSHYGEQDGECYYAMELVEGETLEARVRREGPLAPALVLEIGVQVARALAAAEVCGVVHRDLKPSNIMLTTHQGENAGPDAMIVKVIDWGLAKAVGAESVPSADFTQGGFVGTPAFASPEQYSRAPDRRIDARSDIYSLGVTLWYLLCGKTPFGGTSLDEIHARQVQHPLPIEQLSLARVPGRVVALLKSMMSVDPAARPQSARELLDQLRRCQERFSLAGISPEARRAWRRGSLAATAALLLLAAVAAGGWYLAGLRSAPVNRAIAVLPFQNLSPDKADAFFTAGVRDAIAADLGRIAQLRVTGPGSVKSYAAGKPRDLPAIGRALQVDRLLEGTVRREAGRVHLELTLTDPSRPARKWTKQFDRPLEEEFALLSEVTRTVAGQLGTPPTAAEAALIDSRPTHDPVAYDLYLRAQEGPSVYLSEGKLRADLLRRISVLDEAVARDPAFMLAWCSLGQKHDDIASNPQGATAEELAIDHRALAESAFAQARRLQPNAGEVHLRYAFHYYLITRDLEQARIEAELARRTLPNNVGVETVSGEIALRQGRTDEALRAFEKAITLDPRGLGTRAFYSETAQCLRRYDIADRQLAFIQSLLPPGAVPTLPVSRGMLKLEGQADLAPMRAALADVKDDRDPEHELRDDYGLILATFDHDESRVRYVLAASKAPEFHIANFVYPRAWYEALAARMRNDDAAAKAAFAVAREAVEKTVSANPRDERNLLLLAMIDAGLGRKDEAVREARRACAMAPLEAERMIGPSDRCCLAVVYAWTDQADLAFAELDPLVSGPAGANMPSQPTYGDLKLNPLWDPLRADPRFAALTQRLTPTAAR